MFLLPPGFESILEGLYGPRLRRDLSLFEGKWASF